MYRIRGPEVLVTTADSDIRMQVDTSDAIGRTIHLYGCWEHGLTEFLRSYLKPHMRFLDVGANIGYFTLFAAKRCAHAYGFEASPEIARRFQRNAALNPSLPATAHAVAVSDTVGMVTFHVDANRENQGLSSLMARGNSSPVSVPSISLDAFIQRESIPKVDIMKIDVEGAEELVFRGARELFERDSPDLIFEANPGSTAHRIIRDLGYALRELPTRPYEAPNLFASKHFSLVVL